MSDDSNLGVEVIHIKRYDKFNAERRCFDYQYVGKDVTRTCQFE